MVVGARAGVRVQVQVQVQVRMVGLEWDEFGLGLGLALQPVGVIGSNSIAACGGSAQSAGPRRVRDAWCLWG